MSASLESDSAHVQSSIACNNNLGFCFSEVGWAQNSVFFYPAALMKPHAVATFEVPEEAKNIGWSCHQVY